ncbi:MAG TPA: hypothetical protein VFO39_06805 [Candidatus Sulfotelmatobacter sp.]|nr:hypothetical protein [Candidatus Sulfotelmatobacter sp.]
MVQIPQIVRERLKAAQTPSPHLDADVLAAFSERSLGKSERDAVMAHLARCAECRDVVALALPPSETEVQPAFPAFSRGWFTWPAFRWGMVAAAAVVAAVALSLRHSGQKEIVAVAPAPTDKLAYKAAADKVVPAAPAAQMQREAKRAEAPKFDFRKQIVAKAKPAPESFLAVPPGEPRDAETRTAGRAGGIAGGTVAFDSAQAKTVNGLETSSSAQPVELSNRAPVSLDKPAAPSLPASSETVTVESEAPVIATNQLQDMPLQGRVDQQDRKQLAMENTDVTRAKAAPEAAGGGAAISAARMRRQSGLHWMISSTGVLQHSPDGGRTWNDVNVLAPSAYTATMAEIGGLSKLEKASAAKSAKKDRKELPPSSPNLVFRSVVAVDSNVWAGANDGMLFHSIDAGVHWTRVVPLDSGVALTGDVVSIEFADLQNGRIATSSLETWVTADGGQSWQKR